MRRRVVCAVTFALLSVTGASAQTTTGSNGHPESPTFKAGGEEVVLDVVVRDKKGHLVRDLKPSDFELTDNGERRTIKSLHLVEGTEAMESTDGTRKQLDPLRQIRLITLIFHGLDQNGRVLARQAALDLLKSELGQNVYMSVLAIDHTLEAIQRFTNDRALLKKAVERATSGAQNYADDTVATMRQLEQITGPVQGGNGNIDDRVAQMSNGASGASGPSGAPDGTAVANAAMAQIMLRMMNSSKEDATTDLGRGTIFSLLDAVKEQYRLPGRKTILLFSSGFAIPQGAEQQFKTIISMANRSNVSFYSVDTHGLSTRSTNNAALDGLDSAVAGAYANATARKGVTTDMARSEDRSLDAGRKDTQLTLGILAHETGGELIANTNDFRGPLRRLQEEVQTYYEVSYSPDLPKYDGAFRKVSVKTTEPSLKVQAPSGYFALPPNMAQNGQAIAPFEVPLLKALEQKPLPRDFVFQSAGLHYRGEGGAPTGEVVLDVPLSDFEITKESIAGNYGGQFAYVALIKDGQGTLLKKFRNEVPLRITEDKLEAYKAGHFVYTEPFPLKPGRYILETALLDTQSEKISARKSSFIVPAQDNVLSISSIAIVRNMKPAGETVKADDPLLVNHQIVTPSISPVVKKSSTTGLPFYVVVYANKSSAEVPSLQMEFDRDGQLLGRIPAELGKADAQGRIPFVVTAPIEKFDPGNYQVRFIAKQGNEAAVETTTFTIEP
jgi:VWFA-related protein